MVAETVEHAGRHIDALVAIVRRQRRQKAIKPIAAEDSASVASEMSEDPTLAFVNK
jgi:hypothetical protein